MRTTSAMSGMTLLELTVTLGVVSIIAGLGLTSLQGTLAASREANEIHEVEEHLLETRSVARNLGRNVTLSVVGDTLIAESGETAVRSYILGKDIAQLTIDTPTGTLTFNARGGVDADGPVDVVVVTTRRQVHRFRIYPAIGTVRRTGS